MDEMLMMRLNLLKDAGEIDEKIAEAVVEFAKEVEREYNAQLNEDNGSMLITHLCMALGRIKKGEEINPIDELSLQEIKATPAFQKVPNLVKSLEKITNLVVPEEEFGYIALHLCTMEQKIRMKGGK